MLFAILEISTQAPVITLVRDDSVRDLLGFNKTTTFEEYNLSKNTVDILSFDNNSLERDIAQDMIFKGKRCVKLHIFTVDVDPGYK